MTENAYLSGRLNMPFVGHCTFGKAPACVDWNAIDADAAILGVPNDMGTQWHSGARFGPRGIREASTLFSFGQAGAYDHEDDTLYLTRDQVPMVDVGDADIVQTDLAKSHANTELAVRTIRAARAMPLGSSAVITRSTHRSLRPSIRWSPSTSFISMRILISSMNALACAMAMAIPCGAPRKWLISPA